MGEEGFACTRRNRKPVQRFEAVPASYRAPGGDFAKAEHVGKGVKSTGKKRAKTRRSDEGLLSRQSGDEKFEPLRCPPEDMHGKRVKVFWARPQQHYHGEVFHTPGEEHPFRIEYDDGDSDEGTFFDSVFVTKQEIHPYEVVSGQPSSGKKTTAVKKPAAQQEPAPEQKQVRPALPERVPAPERARPQPQLAVSLPSQRPTAQANLETPPLTPTPGIMAKFEQNLKRQTSGAAKNEAASPRGSAQPGSGRNPGVVLGIPVAGQSGTAVRLAPRGGLSQGPSTLETLIPEWTAEQAGNASKQLRQAAVQALAPLAAAPAVAKPPVAAAPAQTIRNGETGNSRLVPHAELALSQSPTQHALQADGAAARQAEQPEVEAPSRSVPATPAAASPAMAAEEGAAAAMAAAAAETSAKRKRGRQPKAQAAGAEQEASPAKKRGRPRKSDGDKAKPQSPVDAKMEVAAGWQKQPAGAPDQAASARAAEEQATDQDKAGSKNGHGPLAEYPDALPAQRPVQQDATEDTPQSLEVAAPAPMDVQQNGLEQEPQAQEAAAPAPMPKQQHEPEDRLPAEDAAVPASVPEQQETPQEEPQAQDAAALSLKPEQQVGPQDMLQAEEAAASSAMPELRGGPEKGEQGAAQAVPRRVLANKSGTCSPAAMQQRQMSGSLASTSSPRYDARAAAQPPRSGGNAQPAPVSRPASAPTSRLAQQGSPQNMQPPATLEEASQELPPPSSQPQSELAPESKQLEPMPEEDDPWVVSLASTEGRGARGQQAAVNGGAGSPWLSSPEAPGQQPAKHAGAAHPQVTKLVTMLPSRLSPAYTPCVKPPSQTPSKRNSRGGGRALGSPGEPVRQSPATPRYDEDGVEITDRPRQEPKEDLEIAKRRKAQDSIMRKVEAAVKGLTRTKESIRAATVLAAEAAHRGAAARVIRHLIERINKEAAGPRRVDILYLADSVLQNCRNPKCAGCGPDSAPAQAYPRVIAAALPALIKAVAEEPEGARKADKVLNLWAKREMLPPAALQPEIDRLRERLHEHDADASAKAAARAVQKEITDAANNSSSTAVRIGSETGGGALMELKQEDDDDWDDDEAAPLPTLPQSQPDNRAPWQRTGGTAAAVGAAPDSPEGSPWHQGVSPVSSGYEPWSPALSSGGGQGTPQHVPAALTAPWQQPAAPAFGHVGSVQGPAREQRGYPVPLPGPPPMQQAWAPPVQPPPRARPPPAHPPQLPAPPAQPQPPPSNGNAAPQPVVFEPEEGWDSDNEATVPPGLADAPKPAGAAKRAKTWRPGDPDRVDSPGLYPQNEGSVAGPLRAALTQPAQLMDEFDDLYAGSAQPQPLPPPLPPPPLRPPLSVEQFPALFPRPLLPTPAAQTFVPPPLYAVVAAPQEEAPPPLPADEPPPLPPEDDDDDDFQPPLPTGTPPPLPPEHTLAEEGIMEVEMQVF